MSENKNAELYARPYYMWYRLGGRCCIYYVHFIVDELYDFYFTFICINYEGRVWKEFSLFGTYTYTYLIYIYLPNLHGIPKCLKNLLRDKTYLAFEFLKNWNRKYYTCVWFRNFDRRERALIRGAFD